MQLKKSKNIAEDELTTLIIEGHRILRKIHDEFEQKIGDHWLWGISIRDWRNKVHEGLIAIFPETLEADTFEITPEPFSLDLFRRNADIAYSNAEHIIKESIHVLSQFKDNRLERYTEDVEQDNERKPLSEQLPPGNTDVLLVTVTEIEAKAILSLLPSSRLRHIGDQTYYDLGIISGAKIFMVQSEMGSGGPSGATLTIEEAIRLLNPSAVIMVGIAFGISESKQSIGDILVSRQLIQYELQRVGTNSNNEHEIYLRDDRPSASPRMLQRFRAAVNNWQTHTKVEFGPILSGAKLIDNQDYRDQLLRITPETIGGEMEGSGLYAVAQRKKVDWIVVKAICDWADGNKHQDKRQRQQLAAKNAASFTLFVLKQGGFERSGREIAEMPLNDAINNDKTKPRTAEQFLNDAKRLLELQQKRESDQGQRRNTNQTMQQISDQTILQVNDAMKKYGM